MRISTRKIFTVLYVTVFVETVHPQSIDGAFGYVSILTFDIIQFWHFEHIQMFPFECKVCVVFNSYLLMNLVCDFFLLLLLLNTNRVLNLGIQYRCVLHFVPGCLGSTIYKVYMIPDQTKLPTHIYFPKQILDLLVCQCA